MSLLESWPSSMIILIFSRPRSCWLPFSYTRWFYNKFLLNNLYDFQAEVNNFIHTLGSDCIGRGMVFFYYKIDVRKKKTERNFFLIVIFIVNRKVHGSRFGSMYKMKQVPVPVPLIKSLVLLYNV